MSKEATNLEALLANFFNGGKKQKLLLSRVKKNAEGEVIECFTKKGAKCYDMFVDAVYGFDKHFETLDDIIDFCKSLKNIGVSDRIEDIIEDTDALAEDMI